MIPVQVVGLAFVFGVAYRLGRREERRLAGGGADAGMAVRSLTDQERSLRRPDRFWVNVALTLVLVSVMISGIVDPSVMFMLGTAADLIVNYPESGAQRARVDAHGPAAVMMAAILLAAGAFTGIMIRKRGSIRCSSIAWPPYCRRALGAACPPSPTWAPPTRLKGPRPFGISSRAWVSDISRSLPLRATTSSAWSPPRSSWSPKPASRSAVSGARCCRVTHTWEPSL
jgi:hypothetical protein